MGLQAPSSKCFLGISVNFLAVFFLFISATTQSYAATALTSDDFESGMGGWVNVSSGDNKNWTRDSAGTPSSNTGPSTGSGGSSYYVYLETSSGTAYTAGDTAILLGPAVSGRVIHFKFDYHMYGSNTGTLAVDVLSGGVWVDGVWSISGQQQSSSAAAYTTKELDLSGYDVSQIRFRAIAAGGYMGDMAIDNVEISTAASGPVAPEFVSDPLTKPEARENRAYAESLAADAVDVNGDSLTFRKVSGPAWLTVAADGGLSGTPLASDIGLNSFEVEVSNGQFSSRGTLEIEALDSSAPQVLSNSDFENGLGEWHNVTNGDNKDWVLDSYGTPSSGTGPSTGADGSTFYVYLETSSGAAFNAGDSAVLEGPPISGSGIQLDFHYHMFGSNMGTLSVDVLSANVWVNDVWSISGQQQASNSAPYATARVDLSGYNVSQIRFRATAIGGFQGDMAIDNLVISNLAQSPVPPQFLADPIAKPDAKALQPYSESIAADARDDNGDPLTFSLISGPAWLSVSPDGTLSGTPLPENIGLNAFTVEVSDGEFSSAGTLEVFVQDSNAPVVLSITDFESGMGDWRSTTVGDNKEWIRDSGGTPSSNTGPTTGGDGSQFYAYLETSFGFAYTSGDTAILEGPVLSSANIELTFQYHMYGSNMGSLSVDVLTAGGWVQDVWRKAGQQHMSGTESYTMEQVDLGGYDVNQIRFRAEAVGGNMGDMAIDNIAIKSTTNSTPDTDGDGVGDDVDLCPNTPNNETANSAGCSPSQLDKDGDGYLDSVDAFPSDPNEWLDSDGDGIGDNGDLDDDNDGVADVEDDFPLDASESTDTDGDGIGNNADTDDDNDGVLDLDDGYPLISLAGLLDSDGDGIPDDCDSGCALLGMLADTDDDGDGVLDTSDAFPLDPAESIDTDGDSIGNNADTDDDDDGVLDINDAFPLDPAESLDTDADGFGDNADADDDNDGVNDVDDMFPKDATETIDTDNDGVGNNADPDDDNDGMPDAYENLFEGLDPLVDDANGDLDGDGVSNIDEYLAGTNPSNDALMAYGVDQLGYIYQIDLLTGQTNAIGSIPRSGFFSPSGVAISPMGVMFLVESVSDILYTVNIHTGLSKQIGSLNMDAGKVGLSFDDAGTLWMVSSDANLYSIDTDSGSATLKGYLGVSSLDSLAWDGQDLYAIASSGVNSVYRIDRESASATAVGDLLNVDLSEQSGLTFQANGTLWGIESNGTIFTIDRATGEAYSHVMVTGSTFKSLAMLFDSDGDGLPDGWESSYGLVIDDASDADSHYDEDALNNLEEFQKGSNPLLSDTDSDGVNDDLDDFPLDETEWLDTDADGIGNNVDDDDDNDGFVDESDPFPLDSNKPQWVKVTHHDVPGIDSGDLFAISVAGVGDVDGDGYDDFIVGRKNTYVKVYSGRDGGAIHSLTGPAYSNYGEVVAAIGDIDGDGVKDFAVAAPITGQVFVYSGASGNAVFTWSGVVSYGEALADAGDVNNDGITDVIIGASDDDLNGALSGAGSVEVRSGADGAVLHRIQGGNEKGYLGSAVTGLGDINSDGYADFALKRFTSYTSNRAVVSIYSGRTGGIIRSIDGYYGSTFGYRLENMGDLDGDNINDLGVSSPQSGPSDSGTIYLVSSKTLKWISSKSGEAWSRAGYGLSNASDFDGDGTNDYLMSLSHSGQGKAWLVSGATQKIIYEFLPQSGDDDYGYAVGYAGDVNGDGADDYIIGASGNGRVEVVSLLLDSDSDGVADSQDAFPMDDTAQ
ncbi:MAG: putative Ig domain-containing protein [Candidatus Thiodiazotropha sp.]